MLYHEAQMEDDPKKRQAKEKMITDINSKDKKKSNYKAKLSRKENFTKM